MHTQSDHGPVARSECLPARHAEAWLRALWLLPAALLLAALLAPTLAHSTTVASTAKPYGAAERYTLPGPRVAIYNLAGTAVLEAGTGSGTVVEITRGGSEAGQLKVATGEAEERRNLRVIYPGSHIVYPPMGWGSSNSTKVRDDGTFGGHDTGWSGHTVRITGAGGGTEAHADLHVLVPKGTDVLLRLSVGDVRVANVDSKLYIDTGSGAVATSDTRGDLDIDTGSGAVRVARAQGQVKIDTGSGEVHVHDVKGGDLVVDTGSGAVEASGVDVPSLAVDTGSGHVTLDDVNSGSVHVDTGSGGVDVALQDIDDLNIDTGSGGVHVQLPKDAGAMLALEAGSGGLDVDLPMTSVRREHGELHGQMGDGKGHIVIETGSGGIHIAGR